MDSITLNYSSSYRAITDSDIRLLLGRNVWGFDGHGIPMKEVIITDEFGNQTTIPPGELFPFLTPYELAHNPRPGHIDLVSPDSDPGYFLRFQVEVDPPPIWEDYVEATYEGANAQARLEADFDEFKAGVYEWIGTLVTFPFQAAEATLGDPGGTLAEFTSSSPLVLEDFAEGWQFFPLVILGSAFDDSFSAGDHPAELYGLNGDDLLGGSDGDDFMTGGSGDDFLYGGKGVDIIFGNGADDHLFGGLGNDSLDGGKGNDTLDAGRGLDRIRGGDGNDLLLGFAGKDTLYGGNGSDSLDGGSDNDSLFGDEGNDRLIGEDGADSLFGGAGTDTLFGETGNDSLSGDDGSDRLIGGAGNDKMRGGEGADRFDFIDTGVANADRIIDFLPSTDGIGLLSSTFAKVRAGLDAGEFRVGIAAVDGDDRIIYDQASGQLYYDPDGTRNGAGSAPQQLIATLANHAALTYQDFFVF